MKKRTVATWNVRTIQSERRTVLIARELQETHFGEQGQLQEEDYTFFWVGKTVGLWEAGVAFAVHNAIAKQSRPDLCLWECLSRKGGNLL